MSGVRASRFSESAGTSPFQGEASADSRDGPPSEATQAGECIYTGLQKSSYRGKNTGLQGIQAGEGGGGG